MPTSICPECTEEVFVDSETEQGDEASCDECGSKLVVVGLDPIEMDLQDNAEDGDASRTDEFGGYELDEDHY